MLRHTASTLSSLLRSFVKRPRLVSVQDTLVWRHSAGSSATFITENERLPTRSRMLSQVTKGGSFDLLVIGGGATGSGVALDAVERGLKVVCVEKEDFSSATSSRSTKLLWGGSRYLAQAMVGLLNLDLRLLRRPRETFNRFMEEFRMVLNCHRERKFLLDFQPHLTYWQPIAVPLSNWLIWPPPFNYPPAALGPLGLFTIFFKFYDSLSGFSSPPSHIMTPKRSRRKFPQLRNNAIKYCSIFYEGMHDDARTNLAIAQTAALHGANMLNYCEVVNLTKDLDTGKIIGATVRDTLSGNSFEVKSKAVLLCGGPFTDELRRMEDQNATEAVTGASGIHIVLPSYFAPAGIGLVDMNTSDGRFLFFLPWQGHVLVGTTDHKCKPTSRPMPAESEIKWLLHEASKYLSTEEFHLRRKDVLSAWSGIRPLAIDPHSTSTASASRDHVISHNSNSGMVFVSGGKWTTYREMAEDAVNKVLEVTPALKMMGLNPCKTLSTRLIGYEGYSPNLEIRLIQEHDISPAVAHHLARTYGGRSYDVLKVSKELAQSQPPQQSIIHTEYHERLLLPGHPYLEGEVVFAVRHDWACHPEDFLARRIRLLFLNKAAALRALPRVVQLMAQELHWSTTQQRNEFQRAVEYMRHFGGSKPSSDEQVKEGRRLRISTVHELQDIFTKIDESKLGRLNRAELLLAGELLDHPLTDQEVDDCMKMAKEEFKCDGETASMDAFIVWWNSERSNPELIHIRSEKMLQADQMQGSGVAFG